jgi:hypothetical protein
MLGEKNHKKRVQECSGRGGVHEAVTSIRARAIRGEAQGLIALSEPWGSQRGRVLDESLTSMHAIAIRVLFRGLSL